MILKKHHSIRRKVTMILMVTSSTALLLAGLAFMGMESYFGRRVVTQDLQGLSEIIAFNASPSVVFRDPDSGGIILEALKARKHITIARIHMADGSVLASYPVQSPEPVESMPLEGTVDRLWFAGGRINLTRRILTHEGVPTGVLFLQSDQGELKDWVVMTGIATVGILLLLALATFAVVSRAQGLITKPILDLAKVATTISNTNNYSARAIKSGDDELGNLVDAFNTMLERIQVQDRWLTEQKDHLEDEVASRTSELVAAKDLAETSNRTKSAFLANMSHELRTPLNAILLYSQVIKDEAADAGAKDILVDISRVESAGRHLLHLISDVLDMAKIEAGKMSVATEPFRLRDLLEDILATEANLAGENKNTLTVEVSPAIPTMVSDLGKVRQVLLNLLSNACKFTRHGRIHVEAGLVEELQEVPWVSISVTDSGIGISEEQMRRLFNDFVQGDDSTTRKYGGTGLGLALSRKLCQMLGGDIRVKSELGSGSTFTVLLPLHAGQGPVADERLAGPEAQGVQSHHSRGRRVLLVDDDPSLLDSLTRLLARDGFVVQVAHDGVEGLDLAKAMPPDIIVVDVMMPRMDGWEVLAALKADPLLAGIPVIMLSILEEVEKGLSLGAVDYLCKPIDRTRLSRVLIKHLPSRPTKPVLIVEDHPPTLAALERIIQAEGLGTTLATDGVEALASMAREMPEMILLDLMMPNMDGFQFLVEKQRNPAWADLPIVVVTAVELSMEDRAKLREAGVKTALQKGAYGRDDLIREVSRLIHCNCGV